MLNFNLVTFKHTRSLALQFAHQNWLELPRAICFKVALRLFFPYILLELHRSQQNDMQELAFYEQYNSDFKSAHEIDRYLINFVG